MLSFLGKLLDSNEKQINKLRPIVERVNLLEAGVSKLSDIDLKRKTEEFKRVIFSNEKTLNEILPEAFAVCREGIRRSVGQRAFDVQLMAGIVLHEGKIAEQRTGEGKTHAATFAAYLNALSGLGVHLVTVNDYLARRDAGWYGKALHFLGLSVGCIISQEKSFIFDPDYTLPEQVDERLAHLKSCDRKTAYGCDVTYGTNNEFGFDYLRDNCLTNERSQESQRGYNYAIVDEVDFALIDEARTPLIISGAGDEATQKYYEFAKLVERLVPKTDFSIEEKYKSAALSEIGISKIEKWLSVDNLYEKDFQTVHHIEQALKAKTLFHRDRDYMIRDGQVVIVDEFTGRPMFGKRYSEGLHQAIEAKEGLKVQQESKTYAMTSFQNYFRMYKKLAGMTGTAVTEAEEFFSIYKLEVVVIPTNRKMVRMDLPDLIFKNESGKWQAVVRDIESANKNGRPVLVGTTSIEKNELLGSFLKHKGIKYQLLNAKNHEQEARILSLAGQKGAVTIATNMAGRGVDIMLGQGIAGLGGLHVIGTERHESRRIDNQLRGRSGRQGDTGSSRFYLSLQDNLMRIFGGEQVAGLMERFGFEENAPLEHPLVSRSISEAQRKVEGNNFDARKHTVEFDDVLNKQREVIYTLRRRVLEIGRVVSGVNNTAGDDRTLSTSKWLFGKIEEYHPEIGPIWEKYEEKSPIGWNLTIRQMSLPVIDTLWMEHLTTIEDLREGIGLRGYAGTDPLVVYKKEAHLLFKNLLDSIYDSIAERILKFNDDFLEKEKTDPTFGVVGTDLPSKNVAFVHESPTEVVSGSASGDQSKAALPIKREEPKVGRNELCPCGSGKKYKHCHGK